MSRRSKKTGHIDLSSFSRTETSNSLPWPEWSDVELNAEQWDYSKGSVFIDPQQIVLPRSLRSTLEWKRFVELNGVDAPVLHAAIPDSPDLTTNNQHLMHSEFIRCFVSSLVNLQYCGRNGLEVENSIGNFIWNLGDERWQGWFNVYSLNKAGKGASHRPVLNPSGKYVVRIFHMARWRRILVDDLIPVDEDGTPLLPRTSNANELWPMILAKAILKIAALSWTEDREIFDCSIITCLTGWIELSLDASSLTLPDRWELLTKYVKHFEWSREDNTSMDRYKLETSDKSKLRRSKTTIPKPIRSPEELQPILLFLSLGDARNVDNDEEVPGITPCLGHDIYVEMSRDVPLDPSQARAPLAKWKNHRWLDWAIRRGFVDASDYFVPLRCLLVTSPLAQYTSSIERKSDTHFLTNNSETPETSIWVDFNKLSQHVREIHLYYRRKFFEHSEEVTRTATELPIDKAARINSSRKESKRMNRESRGSTIVEERAGHQERMLPSWLYLFVDSVDPKFFLINLSTETWSFNGDGDVTNSVDFSSLTMEKHDIFDERIFGHKAIGTIRTRGTRSIVFQLEPGRHLLRIITNVATIARIVIISNTRFEVGELSRMHELMVVEATRIEKIARQIDDSVMGAFEAFGTSDHSSRLRNYYRSYSPHMRETVVPTNTAFPGHQSRRKLFKSLHEWFVDEFFKFIEKRFSPTELSDVRRSMRIFFLDSSIGATITRSESCPEENEEHTFDEEDSRIAKNAAILQSFFRMLLIKRYRDIHDSSHPEHQRVKETLLRIGHVFHTEHGPHYVLRAILENHATARTLYTWVGDLRHVIVIRELRGRIGDIVTSTNRWIPIVRTNVNASSDTSVLVAIDLSTSLSNCTVRSFDNETLNELPRLGNIVTPNRYVYREKGYTIFTYGWTSDEARNKVYDWCLRLATIKGQPVFHSIDKYLELPATIELPSLRIVDVSKIYLPNARNRLFRLIIRITRDSLVSIRLATSYDKALTVLRVTRENGTSVTDIEGGANLIVPLVFLEYQQTPSEVIETPDVSSEPRRSSIRKKRESGTDRSAMLTGRDSAEERTVAKPITRYTIEAFVLEDSWPLTEAEWITVMELRAASTADAGKSRESLRLNEGRKTQRSRHSGKKTSTDFIREPYWSLRIATDPGNDLDIVPDTSIDERIEELQKLWSLEDSERIERGKKLRRSFLENGVPSVTSTPIKTDVTFESFHSTEFEAKKMSSERTLEPPANISSHLPKLDLTIYMVKDDEEEDRWVKTEFDEETLRNQRAINVLDFEQHRSSLLEESSRIIEARSRKYRRLAQRYAENRQLRDREMNEAYETRRAYVESVSRRPSVRSKLSSKAKKAR